VDVDDLPTDLKRDTLERREREKASGSAAAAASLDVPGAEHRQSQDVPASVQGSISHDSTSAEKLSDKYFNPQILDKVPPEEEII
jgi:hypothetical protein